MDLGLKDKLVLVTGSGSGIGKATAKTYLQEGARLIVHGLTEAEVAACVDDLSPLGYVKGIAVDLTNQAGATALADFAIAQGEVDILINNVGIFSVKPFEDLTDEDWMHYFNINVLSAVRMSRIFLPAMLKRGTGAIINMASEAAVKPLPQMVHYSVTKTAMLGLTRGMAELTKGTKVRVNSILPGPTWTEGVEAYFDELADQKGEPLDTIVDNYFKSDEPTSLIQRFVQPDEVARMIVTISASTASNGAAHRIEGGIVRNIL
ncbi:NAD(P)-dependent dehydrogenase (short-subunit alcohol dehydrogenase family) [Planktotalea frisia]|uniref:(S)-1-phenylethanol dehydrogenase n=1 Tax=Planktotalea frisia TaxID=696762 RepID=A0A1L9NU42_9RHOB|nr:SDR family oxidoreductase [Planktotalea frisia]OJI92703.1 (S)-1-phenylethanol dehydrogenase [Planktotalea frisia]PZX24503.1 NAD(P)-dependent dehydrogenase (short-subunit alcohol dehydrogenase family) [Planktotalea frisia]